MAEYWIGIHQQFAMEAKFLSCYKAAKIKSFFVRVRGDVYIRHLTNTHTRLDVIFDLSRPRATTKKWSHSFSYFGCGLRDSYGERLQKDTQHTHSSFWCSGLVRITSKLDCLKSESYVADTALRKNTHRTKLTQTHTHTRKRSWPETTFNLSS